VDVRNDQLEAFSGQGPTDDNRLKPEVAGPDNTESTAYNGRFPGTSAACPHVSGFAALLKQLHPNVDHNQLRAEVTRSVRPKGSPVPNPLFGFGFIDAGKISGAGGGGNDHPGPTPGPGPGRITIPRTLGGTVSSSVLDRLRNKAAQGEASDLKINVVVGKKAYAVGEGLKIGMKASDDCYYMLVDRDASGKYTLISPQSGDEEQLRGGEKYALPRGKDVIRVTPPMGTEEIILVCARKQTDLREWREDNADVSVTSVRFEVRDDR
jgi:hypothetical protein